MKTCLCGMHPESEYGRICPSCLTEGTLVVLEPFEGNPAEIALVVDKEDRYPGMYMFEIPEALRTDHDSRDGLFEALESVIVAVLPDRYKQFLERR